MKTPVACRKFREARFFLRHLVDGAQKAVPNEPEAFGFYLSAFLSAARSVIFALQCEEKKTYNEWFPKFKASLSSEEKELLDFMNTQRVLEVHRLGSQTLTKEKAVPADLSHLFPPHQVMVHPSLILSEEQEQANLEAGLPSWARAWVYVSELYFEPKGEPVQVAKESERYAALIGRLLFEFNKL